MIYLEDFERFPNGLTYTIEFDEVGTIKKATIYVGEIDESLDVTGFVADSKYWQKRVYERLGELADTFEERKFLKAYKES